MHARVDWLSRVTMRNCWPVTTGDNGVTWCCHALTPRRHWGILYIVTTYLKIDIQYWGRKIKKGDQKNMIVEYRGAADRLSRCHRLSQRPDSAGLRVTSWDRRDDRSCHTGAAGQFRLTPPHESVREVKQNQHFISYI